MIGPSFFSAAGYVQHHAEQFPADAFDGGRAGGDAAGVQIDEIRPSFGERGSRGDFDHRGHGESVARSFAGCEHMQIHGSGKLLRAADEIARRGGGENQALGCDALAMAGGRH